LGPRSSGGRKTDPTTLQKGRCSGRRAAASLASGRRFETRRAHDDEDEVQRRQDAWSRKSGSVIGRDAARRSARAAAAARHHPASMNALPELLREQSAAHRAAAAERPDEPRPARSAVALEALGVTASPRAPS